MRESLGVTLCAALTHQFLVDTTSQSPFTMPAPNATGECCIVCITIDFSCSWLCRHVVCGERRYVSITATTNGTSQSIRRHIHTADGWFSAVPATTTSDVCIDRVTEAKHLNVIESPPNTECLKNASNLSGGLSYYSQIAILSTLHSTLFLRPAHIGTYSVTRTTASSIPFIFCSETSDTRE